MTEPGFKYRPGGYDAMRRRHPLAERARMVITGGGTRVARARFLLSGMLAGEVTHLGVEELTPEGRQRASQRASERLRTAGVDALPLPQTGRAYEFTLRAMGGELIRSKELRGKVVLIDCWATWCTPCMQKMPHLKELYARWHDRGLEVIGVNFDGDEAKARRASETLGLAWPQVAVSGKEEIQGLWEVASGIDTLPRLLILDREGVLRFDCGPAELENRLAALLEVRPKE
jgi:thiol-disulfide isomerase/thioredoxin